MRIALLCFLALVCRAEAVRFGEVWIIANRWGAYPAVLLGTVRDGAFTARRLSSFPEFWDQAFDYRLLIGASDRPMPPPPSPETDYGYGLGVASDYFKRFQFC